MLIAGNWKINGTRAPNETRGVLRAAPREVARARRAPRIVCPAVSVAALTAVGMLAPTEIAVFAQNAHWAEEGS